MADGVPRTTDPSRPPPPAFSRWPPPRSASSPLTRRRPAGCRRATTRPPSSSGLCRPVGHGVRARRRVLLHRAHRQHQLGTVAGQRRRDRSPGRRRRRGRGRDDGHRRRSRLRQQPPHLHLLHDGHRRARRALGRRGRTSPLDAGTPIVTGIQRSSSGRHSGCRTRFGPDGDLWITTGDAAHGTNPQDLEASLNGKVLRVDDRRQARSTATCHQRPDVADLRLRLPQPAGHLVPPERRPAVPHRARLRPRRRDHADRRRRQRRLEPGAGLQRVRPDDELRPRCQRDGAAVVLGLPDDRPVRRHVRDVGAVG